MKKIANFRQKNKGAIALLLVVMITALTIVSAAVISMINTSDLMSSYSFSESEQSSTETDTCLEDALWRLASSTYASGTYYLNGAGINCYYQISDNISAGLITVTSTASTTSSVGSWQEVVIAQINVSSTPIRINSYKNFNLAYDAIGTAAYCGDASCNGSETCGDDDVAPSCNTDCGACPDTTAPAAISDLALSGATTDSIDLDWTAPGDDNSTGTATTYDVRYSTSLISEANWSSATQATGEPSPSVAGSAESMTVSGLSSGTTYYFAIKTSDEVPNTSSISNVPNEATTSGGGPVCGDGVKESPETCDYLGPEGTISGCFTNPVGCPARRSGCQSSCSLCVVTCNSIGGL